MPNARTFASLLLISLSATSFARGIIYKCQDRDGRTTLRDEHCRADERMLASVRSSEVPREFSVAAPLKAAEPLPAAAKKPPPTLTLPSQQ